MSAETPEITKHAGGRPLKYQSVEQFQADADKYFADTEQELWTITGLAVALNTSRVTLMDYQERDEFFNAIKGVKDKIEMAYEIGLRRRGGAGDIFGLKNFGWKDKTEVDSTVVADVTSNGETIAAPEMAEGYAEWLKSKQ